jgi:hydrogenase maturation protease
MTPETAGRPRVLVAGVGNIFLGDDAFGVAVVQRLALHRLPDAVRVVDFGIRGLDLVYALLDGYEAVILVDAVPRGGRPGTLYVLEPEVPTLPEPAAGGVLMEAHDLGPAKVLRLAASLGAPVRRLLLVGCEPEPAGETEEMRMELSAAVRAAVDEAVPLIESLVAKLLSGAAVPGGVACAERI